MKHVIPMSLFQDLINDLKSELSGDLEELILALFKPTTFYDAYSLHKAMSVRLYIIFILIMVVNIWSPCFNP